MKSEELWCAFGTILISRLRRHINYSLLTFIFSLPTERRLGTPGGGATRPPPAAGGGRGASGRGQRGTKVERPRTFAGNRNRTRPPQLVEAPSSHLRWHARRDSLIKVATSVCTGVSNMPPAYCILDVRVLRKNSKTSICFLLPIRHLKIGTPGGTRTPDLLLRSVGKGVFSVLKRPFDAL